MPDKPKAIPFTVTRQEAESPAAAEAKATLRPSAQAAQTLRYFNPFFGGDSAGKTDPNEIAAELQRHAKDASANNLTRFEAMLATQAHTLDAIFNDMARRAAWNRGEYLDATDKFMRLALKAQSQCRSTIETLAEIKNPKPVAFVQQANIAAGHQQVNYGTRAADAKAGNELLETGYGNRLEQGAKGAAAVGDPTLEAMAGVHRTKIPEGESNVRAK